MEKNFALRMWTLVNSEERANERPESFKIPSRDVRDNLNAGMLAKLIFEFEDPDLRKDGIEAERMWVKVTGRDGSGYYKGVLDNDPMYITGLKADDEIRFGPENVIDIWED